MADSSQKIATDIYTFSELITKGFTYVDKTAILWTLVNESLGKQFFIARPRRFGKSLAISTLRCLFEGRRELFKGLAIEPLWDWTKTWPVIHLDMGSCQAATPQELRMFLSGQLEAEARRLGLPFERSAIPSMSFTALVRAAAQSSSNGQCVVLVDEYDKPVLAHLGKPDVHAVREELKPFYGVIKYTESLQRFALITGVSKFSKVSIFSDLNNLNDFSMDARVGTLFGYTHEEVLANFRGSLAALGARWGWTGEKTFAELVKWYDGYRFEERAPYVFNPVSIGKCLSSLKIEPYWFETGTPTFLLDLMAQDPINLDDVEIPITAFSVYEPDRVNLYALLYQTGYLTIKGDYWDGEDHFYKLGAPDLEVSKAFSESLVTRFSGMQDGERASLLTQMVKALRGDDVNDMLDALSCFFANIPANITVKREKYYQSLFYAVFVLIGARTHAECWTNRGRIDAVVETSCGIYVFEFKLAPDGRAGSPMAAASLAQQALQQIKDKGYAEKYRRAGKKLTLIGAAFDATQRNLSDRAIETT